MAVRELLVFVGWVDWDEGTGSCNECCRWKRKGSPGLRQARLPTSSELARVWEKSARNTKRKSYQEREGVVDRFLNPCFEFSLSKGVCFFK